jgi:hypothetical protein
LQAIKDYERRLLGNLQVSLIFSKNYKGIQAASWQTTAAHNIGGSVSVLTQIGRASFKDKGVAPTETADLIHQSVGLEYKGIRHGAQGWFDNYRNNGSFNGYRLYTNHYVSDQFVLGLDTWRAPMEDVQALNPVLAGLPDSRIMTTNYRVRADVQDGTNDLYSFSYTRGVYSDDNRVNTYDVSWYRSLKYTDKINTAWFTYFGWSDWKLQRPDLYESPTARETMGTGLTKRWIIKQGENPTGVVNAFGIQNTMPQKYLEGTAVFEWGRDRSEPFDFAPSLRLEYGLTLSPTQSLVIGAEYGLHTDRLNNNHGLNFAYRQYDLAYSIVW